MVLGLRQQAHFQWLEHGPQDTTVDLVAARWILSVLSPFHSEFLGPAPSVLLVRGTVH